jgi:hypothetical protein
MRPRGQRGPHGHHLLGRIERVLVADGRVVLEVRPVGLAVDDTVRVTLPSEAVVDRLGSAGE